MATPTRIDLHLQVRVKPGFRQAFLDFLREAAPYYESPGGIEVRLLQDFENDHRFIELVLYDDEQTYERDQQRVMQDERMKQYLARWRELLAEPPIVKTYRLSSF